MFYDIQMKPEIALYDAFTEVPFGGSQAAVIADASGIALELRPRLARELGLPATAFVDAIDEESVSLQFFSTVMELPMCGHGTVCLMTHLAEQGLVSVAEGEQQAMSLRLPGSNARVELERRQDGRIVVMLDVTPPRFEAAPEDLEPALSALGISTVELGNGPVAEIARGDFVHLVIPLVGLDAMRKIKPDFGAIVEYCHQYDIETFAVYCLETENSAADLHVRDFCPAVGVSESAAAGTTNAALASYLLRHELIRPDPKHEIMIHAEQGIELGRPSSVRSKMRVSDSGIERLQVGGVATRVLQGEVYLPE